MIRAGLVVMEPINVFLTLKVSPALLHDLLQLLEAKYRERFLFALHVLPVFLAKLHPDPKKKKKKKKMNNFKSFSSFFSRKFLVTNEGKKLSYI